MKSSLLFLWGIFVLFPDHFSIYSASSFLFVEFRPNEKGLIAKKIELLGERRDKKNSRNESRIIKGFSHILVVDFRQFFTHT